jgi:AcrR family transcriptional regulator
MQYLCIKRRENFSNETRMARELIRQSARSARIQKAVHDATRNLLAEVGRAEINVPLIAARAAVTPSTIYRRWGDLQQLLADVAAERLRPVGEPDDTGSLAGDLQAYILQYAEEMSTPVGRQLLRDVLAESSSDDAATRCCAYTTENMEILRSRALARGEDVFDVDEAIDALIAPMMHRILFSTGELSQDYARTLLERYARARLGARPRLAAFAD